MIAATECDCTEDYGPCEDHATTVIVRQGASTRTADELAVSTVNIGAESGSIGIGDTVLCGGYYSTVTRVEILPIGHTHPPIRSDWFSVVVTTENGTRSLGAPVAYIGGDLRVHWNRETATTCDCTEDYGPCEDHATTVIQREGASTRTADELAVIYCDDAAGLLEDIGGTVLDTDHELIRDAWELLEAERRMGVAWFPESDAGEMLDEVLRLGDALMSDLFALGYATTWDDGYIVSRVHEDSPLLND
jgi:hypothetical protein